MIRKEYGKNIDDDRQSITNGKIMECNRLVDRNTQLPCLIKQTYHPLIFARV